jgi:hypothetical protein
VGGKYSTPFFSEKSGRIVMRLPTNEELETWSKKFREMFR